MYREYTDLIDVLTHIHVYWQPYDDPDLRGHLSPKCWQENEEFRSYVPLVFFHVVEMHYPIRVCTSLLHG